MTRNHLFIVLLNVAVTTACVDMPTEATTDEASRRKPGWGQGHNKNPDAGVDSETGSGDDTGSGDGSGSDDGSGSGSGSGTDGSGGADSGDPAGTMLSTGCSPYTTSVYTPFTNYGPVTLGSVFDYAWEGPEAYPQGLEDFQIYTAGSTVECSGNKSLRNYLDVTSGCLTAVAFNGGKVGKIGLSGNGGYRSFALPHDPQYDRQVGWQDQGVEFRFYYSTWTPEGVNPGFKAFVRYMTEYDLYVGSWRKDGVVQIQKKQCGVYTTLKRIATYGAPSPNTWHTIRMEAVGTELRLYLDGTLAMTTNDSSIKTGTAGIRIDAADGSLVDDWRVYAP